MRSQLVDEARWELREIRDISIPPCSPSFLLLHNWINNNSEKIHIVMCGPHHIHFKPNNLTILINNDKPKVIKYGKNSYKHLYGVYKCFIYLIHRP